MMELLRKFFIQHQGTDRESDFVKNKNEKIKYVLDRMVDVDIGVLKEFLDMYLAQTEKKSGRVESGNSDYQSFED